MNNTTSEEETDSYQLFNLQEPRNIYKPLEVMMLINKKKLSMEQGPLYHLSVRRPLKLFGLTPVNKNYKLPMLGCTHTQRKALVLGFMEANVCYKGQTKTLKLYVVGGDGPSLLGRDWLTELQLDWRELHFVNQLHQSLQEILNKHLANCVPRRARRGNRNHGKTVREG